VALCVLFSPKEGVYIKEDNSTTPCEVWKLHKQPQTSKSFPSPPELPSARASTQIHLQPPQEASNIVEGPNIQRSVHHQAASSTMKDHRPPPCDGMEGKKHPPPPVTIQLMTGERCCRRRHHQWRGRSAPLEESENYRRRRCWSRRRESKRVTQEPRRRECRSQRRPRSRPAAFLFGGTPTPPEN
jgi:hypothetical protein